MFDLIRFPAEVEELVLFVEETDPEDIIQDTLYKLRHGVSPRDLLRAGALAVCRSTELPPEHHGGPVHPICGIHGVYNTSIRLTGEMAFMPIVQHVALCNNHVHSPQMGPYLMPEMKPLEGKGSDIGSYHLSDPLPSSGRESTLGDTEEAFLKSIQVQRPSATEQYYLRLQQDKSPGEVLDLILPAAISRNSIDDHYFIYPMFTTRALDVIGWEWAPVLMRVVVRYQARNPFSLSRGGEQVYATAEALLDEYLLLEKNIPMNTSDRETEAIGELGAKIGACNDYRDALEPMARALADGLSLEGAGEALSIGASTAYLRSSYGNPMDSHLHTGTNARRYLLNMEGISLRNRVLALLTGITGPECLTGAESSWDQGIDPEAVSALPDRSQGDLLDAIIKCIEDQPFSDWSETGLDLLIAPSEVKGAMLLAQQYADKRYDPTALFQRIGELACRDDFTELHGIKHHQAIFDEFCDTRDPFRWLHLVAAVKSAAVLEGGKEQKIYGQTRELLTV
jgi:hypothetical protein